MIENNVNKSWVRQINHTWRIKVHKIMTIFLVLAWLAIFITNNQTHFSFLVLITIKAIGVLILILYLLWLFFALRCPFCGFRYAWFLMNKNFSLDYQLIDNFESCPNCVDSSKIKIFVNVEKKQTWLFFVLLMILLLGLAVSIFMIVGFFVFK